VPERVWQELSRGLMEQKPSRMLDVLRGCGALKRLLPEVDRLWGVPQRADYHPEVDTGVHLCMVLDMSARLQAPLSVRFACLMHDLGKGSTPADVLPRHIGHEMRSVKLLLKLCERWRMPRDCKELAEVVAREHGHVHRCADLSAPATLRLLERCDAIRRPARFDEFLLACECDVRGRLHFEVFGDPLTIGVHRADHRQHREVRHRRELAEHLGGDHGRHRDREHLTVPGDGHEAVFDQEILVDAFRRLHVHLQQIHRQERQSEDLAHHARQLPVRNEVGRNQRFGERSLGVGRELCRFLECARIDKLTIGQSLG